MIISLATMDAPLIKLKTIIQTQEANSQMRPNEGLKTTVSTALKNVQCTIHKPTNSQPTANNTNSHKIRKINIEYCV